MEQLKDKESKGHFLCDLKAISEKIYLVNQVGRDSPRVHHTKFEDNEANSCGKVKNIKL